MSARITLHCNTLWREGVCASHFGSLEEARSILRSFDWVVLADGRPLCQSDDAEHEALQAAVGLAAAPSA